MANILCGIYKITCLENNKIYIGSSNNIYKRWREHKNQLNNNKHCNIYLQNEWNLFGSNKFKFEIICTCNEKDRFMLEQDYLDKYLPFNRNGNGYNIQESSSYKKEPNIKIYKCKSNEDYYMIKANGCMFPHFVEKTHCDNTTIDDLEFECILLESSKINTDDKSNIEGLEYWIY